MPKPFAGSVSDEAPSEQTKVDVAAYSKIDLGCKVPVTENRKTADRLKLLLKYVWGGLK